MELENLEEVYCWKLFYDNHIIYFPASSILDNTSIHTLYLQQCLCVNVTLVFMFVMQKWKIQAEANDEAERLLSLQP